MTEPRVEAVARAIHAHNNSGVARSSDTLSWESEPPALQRWHLAMAEAALAAADGVTSRDEENASLRQLLNDARKTRDDALTQLGERNIERFHAGAEDAVTYEYGVRADWQFRDGHEQIEPIAEGHTVVRRRVGTDHWEEFHG